MLNNHISTENIPFHQNIIVIIKTLTKIDSKIELFGFLNASNRDDQRTNSQNQCIERSIK